MGTGEVVGKTVVQASEVDSVLAGLRAALILRGRQAEPAPAARAHLYLPGGGTLRFVACSKA